MNHLSSNTICEGLTLLVPKLSLSSNILQSQSAPALPHADVGRVAESGKDDELKHKCKICFEREIDIVVSTLTHSLTPAFPLSLSHPLTHHHNFLLTDKQILECGHYAVCSGCETAMVRKTCPVCRAPITRVINIFKV